MGELVVAMMDSWMYLGLVVWAVGGERQRGMEIWELERWMER
jgi:hypothetical protein